jgi:hypothetical protein
VARAYIVDDFEAIRARMAEIRGERAAAPAKTGEFAAERHPIRLHTEPGRRLLRDLVIARRFRAGSKIVLSPPEF